MESSRKKVYLMVAMECELLKDESGKWIVGAATVPNHAQLTGILHKNGFIRMEDVSDPQFLHTPVSELDDGEDLNNPVEELDQEDG